MFDWVNGFIAKIIEFFNALFTVCGDLFNVVWNFVNSIGLQAFEYAQKFVVAITNWCVIKVFAIIASCANTNELQFSIITSEIAYFQQINSFFPLYELLSYGVTALIVYMAFLSCMFIVKIVLYALP